MIFIIYIYIYGMKIQNSIAKHSIEMKTFKIYCHHSHKSSHFSPGPSNNVRQMSKKEWQFYWFYHLILFSGLWKMFNGWVIFYKSLQICSTSKIVFWEGVGQIQNRILSWDSLTDLHHSWYNKILGAGGGWLMNKSLQIPSLVVKVFHSQDSISLLFHIVLMYAL